MATITVELVQTNPSRSYYVGIEGIGEKPGTRATFDEVPEGSRQAYGRAADSSTKHFSNFYASKDDNKDVSVYMSPS